MAAITKINNLSKDVKEVYKNNEEIVLLPLSKYNKLLERMEELEDIKDHIEAMKDHKAGKGKKFKDFLNEHKEKFKI